MNVAVKRSPETCPSCEADVPRDHRYRCPECGADLVDDEHGVSR